MKTLRLLLVLLAAAGALAGAARPAAASPSAGEAPAADASAPRSEDVTYGPAELTLAAELMLPAGEGPFPAAVILQGSGPSDRDNGWARAIAEVLRDEGLAVLLTDKRGSGKSAGDWRSAGFGELAADALAGVKYLRTRSDVAADRVGLVGLSQGGWVAPVAASSRPGDAAFVINVSGAAVSFAEQSTFEMVNTSRQAGLTPEQTAVVVELQRLASRYLATGDWEPYAKRREEAMATEWGQIARGFPGEPDAAVWKFLRRVAAFDPMVYWLAVEAPTLVLYGADDEKDNVPVAESVRRLEFAFSTVGKDNARITVIPGAGHAFIADGQLMEPFTAALSAWVREQVVSGKARALPPEPAAAPAPEPAAEPAAESAAETGAESGAEPTAEPAAEGEGR